MSRLRYLAADELNEAQRSIFDSITGGKRAASHASGELTTSEGGLRGPFNAFMHAPAVGDPAQRLGEAVRYQSSISGRLRELAILVVAAKWRAQYEWWAHAKIAQREGLDEAVIAALKAGQRPSFSEPDDALVFDFATELLEHHQVSEPTYAKAIAQLGEQQAVELVVLLGYYTLVSMALNTFEVPLPNGEASPFG